MSHVVILVRRVLRGKLTRRGRDTVIALGHGAFIALLVGVIIAITWYINS